MDSGWDSQAARVVVDLNEDFFEIEREENPARFDREVRSLRRLGRYPRLTPLLLAHPNTAGLLAGVDDPEFVAKSFTDSDSEADSDPVASYYVQHAAPGEAQEFAEALDKHRGVILDFMRRGQIGGEAIFLYERTAPGSGDYDRWLKQALDTQANWSDDSRASFINFVARQGPTIRRRMRDTPEFGTRFQHDLWPKLERVSTHNELKQNMYELYSGDDRVWDLLALDQGEQLLRESGPVAIDLFFGQPELDVRPYPERLRGPLARLLLTGDESTLRALVEYQEQPKFHEFLERRLTTDAFRSALEKLNQEGPAYPTLLAKYTEKTSDGKRWKMCDTALTEEVGPPAEGLKTWIPFYYTVYEVPKKLLQGRDPTAMDWFSAIADPAFLAIDLASAGSGRIAREAVVKGVAAEAEKKVLSTTLRNGIRELAAKQLTKEVAEKLGERELAPWVATSAIRATRRAVGEAIGKATTFEITKPLQFMFHYSGAGRETWKRLTGLEARLFMRGDAKVYVRLSNLAGAVVGSRSAAYFERTAKDLALGVVAESEPGQKATGAALEAGLDGGRSALEQLDAWHKQTSAWWLLNASVSPDDKPRSEGSAP